MKMMILFFAYSTILLSKEIHYSSYPVEIVIPKSGAHLIFPKQVKEIDKHKKFNINTVGNKDSTDYKTFRISPNIGKGSEKISFLLVDRSKVAIKFVIAGKKDFDLENRFELIPSKLKVNGRGIYADKRHEAKGLLKSMRKMALRSGYKAKTINKYLKDGYPAIKTKLVNVYSGRELTGYTIQITNKGNKPLFINEKELRIGVPDQGIISSISNNHVMPGFVTYYFIVARAGQVDREFLFPFYMVDGDVHEK